MSLINKMLQDLDARGGAPGAGADPLLVKPVVRPELKLVPRVALAVVLVALVAVVIWLGLRHGSKPVAPVVKEPLPLAPVPSGMMRVTPPVPVRVPESVIAEPEPEVAPVVVPEPAAKPVRRAPRLVVKPTQPAVTEEGAPVPRPSVSGEAEYRHALADLQDGRVNEAITALERALHIDPRHDAARQTLVGLLVEAKRNDDAVRQLQLGLGLDARQPAMAMLLARLQLEKSNGSAAIDTLQRSLPYATGNGDYQAFLGGVLQRQGRNSEAVTQYQAALAATPGNPIWLMGLGLSLQGAQHPREASVAFQQAAASGTLPPDLQGFVERKVQQLKQ